MPDATGSGDIRHRDTRLRAQQLPACAIHARLTSQFSRCLSNELLEVLLQRAWRHAASRRQFGNAQPALGLRSQKFNCLFDVAGN
jgi:hypothetical protein